MSKRDFAQAVRARRVELGLRQIDLESRGGPSHATLRNMEQAVQDRYTPRTFLMMDKALDWPFGTACALFDGTTLPTPTDRSAPMDLLAELYELRQRATAELRPDQVTVRALCSVDEALTILTSARRDAEFDRDMERMRRTIGAT